MEEFGEGRSIEQDSNLSWADYHASKVHESVNVVPSSSCLLPLFSEESKSIAMIKHSMSIAAKAIQHVNPGQTPCITFDQPLFAIAKQIQWRYPEEYGEKRYVVMMGGLHTEMTLMSCIGKWLEDSGWTSALVQSGITTAGVISRKTGYTHQTCTRGK